MNIKFACILILATLASAEGLSQNKENAEVEARGKAKFALLIHFFYVVATKLFVLKIVYGALFYALIVKGWHFFSWFIHYLKVKKHHAHHEYIEIDHEPHYHNHHYGHDHGHYNDHHNDHDSYGPYAYDKHSYGSDNSFSNYGGYSNNKAVYDADGSYSVKS